MLAPPESVARCVFRQRSRWELFIIIASENLSLCRRAGGPSQVSAAPLWRSDQTQGGNVNWNHLFWMVNLTPDDASTWKINLTGAGGAAFWTTYRSDYIIFSFQRLLHSTSYPYFFSYLQPFVSHSMHTRVQELQARPEGRKETRMFLFFFYLMEKETTTMCATFCSPETSSATKLFDWAPLLKLRCRLCLSFLFKDFTPKRDRISGSSVKGEPREPLPEFHSDRKCGNTPAGRRITDIWDKQEVGYWWKPLRWFWSIL